MYNSDGYVMIDMKDVNMSQSSQHITGIYDRVVSVIDTNKLALIINAGSNTPMAAVVHKRLNYYVINTTLYIFTINSNDIVIIEEAGTATVDVEIVPTLTEGVKVADFAIGTVEGSIYAPAQESEINDTVTATNTTWSSDKISDELSDKADSSSLATVATTGDYSDLSGTPTIPVLTDLIDDSSTAVNKVWSSDKTADELALKADATAVYTKTEVDNALSVKQNSNDNNLSTTDKTVVGAINELNAGLSRVKAYRCKYDYTSWGTSKGTEFTHVPFFRVQIDLDYYIASNGGDYINIRNMRTGTTQGGQIPTGQTSVSVTVDGYTFTKNVSNGKQNLVITTPSNKPIFIEYYL